MTSRRVQYLNIQSVNAFRGLSNQTNVLLFLLFRNMLCHLSCIQHTCGVKEEKDLGEHFNSCLYMITPTSSKAVLFLYLRYAECLATHVWSLWHAFDDLKPNNNCKTKQHFFKITINTEPSYQSERISSKWELPHLCHPLTLKKVFNPKSVIFIYE